jgi:hypothetical protein
MEYDRDAADSTHTMSLFTDRELAELDHSFESSLAALARQNHFNRSAVCEVLAEAGITSVALDADLSRGSSFIRGVSPMAGSRSAVLPVAMVRVLVTRCPPGDSVTGQVTLPQAIEGIVRDFLDVIPGELPEQFATFELDVVQGRLTLGAEMPCAA